MVTATAVGVLFIPVLYYVVERRRFRRPNGWRQAGRGGFHLSGPAHPVTRSPRALWRVQAPCGLEPPGREPGTVSACAADLRSRPPERFLLKPRAGMILDTLAASRASFPSRGQKLAMDLLPDDGTSAVTPAQRRDLPPRRD